MSAAPAPAAAAATPHGTGSAATTQTVSSARWKILAAAIARSRLAAKRDGGPAELEAASVMRFKSFGLIVSKPIAAGTAAGPAVTAENARSWHRYSTGEFADYSLMLHLIQTPTSLQAMMGFNNTGNVCVWPSEEVLAYYCLKHRDLFAGKRVLELGAGMAGLAGFAVAGCSEALEVAITDGNQDSVENLALCVAANADAAGGTVYRGTAVSTGLLVWDRADPYAEHAGRYDLLICADCLFFVDVHIDLCHVIATLLKPGGRAIIIGPRRSGTLEKFIDVARDRLVVTREATVDPVVEDCHLKACSSDPDCSYEPDIHRPILLNIINELPSTM